jgi:hypothetical protein
MTTEIQFFVFIDAENINQKQIDPIFIEIIKYGVISGKRAYADWSNSIYKNWPPILDKHGIRPFQQFHYDKDETDKAIIMDVMEIVYSNENITGICIIGNDHIYGSIARRVREKGLYFLGIGTKDASKKFVDSCNNFIYIDNIEKPKSKIKQEENISISSDLKKLINKALAEIEDDDINLAYFGHMLKKLDPSFDPRTYGFNKLLDLVSSLTDLLSIHHDERIPPIYFLKSK